MSLVSIVRALGGDLYEGGCRANIPAPGHSAQDRSVSLLLSGGRVLAHCFGDGDWRGVLDDLRERGLIDADNRPTAAAVAAVQRHNSLPGSRRQRIAVAERLWSLATPVGRSLAAQYLRRRGIVRPLPGPEALRFLERAPTLAYASRSPTRPALLAGVRAPDGRIQAVELTYLTADGRRAEQMRLPRKTVGVIAPSSAVRLDPLGEALLVGEGVPTTLSASERFALPGWALLSTSNLRHWRPPRGVRRLLVAGDRGKDGEASASKLLARALDLGLEAQVALPPEPFDDWNDWSMAAARGSAVSTG